jgi:hypothetical protein
MVILPSTIIQNGNYLFIEHFLRKWGKRQLFPWYVYKIQPRVVSECRSMMKLCSSTYNWPIRYRDIHQAAWWFFLAVSIWNLWRCRYENKLINAGWWFQTWLLFSIIYIYINTCDNPSHWLSYFSRWFKTRTRIWISWWILMNWSRTVGRCDPRNLESGNKPRLLQQVFEAKERMQLH